MPPRDGGAAALLSLEEGEPRPGVAADGGMRSSAGELVVDYRPWESREQNLRRGVKPEQMKF